MLPRSLMLATKNRAGVGIGLILAMVVLMTACSPPGPRALIRGKKLLDAGNYAAAAQELKIATTLMPTNAVAWNYLGLAYHRAGQGAIAAAAYNRALTLNRDLMEARFNLGCLWLEQNKLDAAKSEFTVYTLRRGEAPEGWLQLGLTQLRATNSQAAEKSYRQALKLNPKSAEALNGLGLAQRQRGRVTEAAQFFSEAVRQQPDYRPALLNLATVSHQDLNNRVEALRRYREYLALQPHAADWEAVNALAQTLSQPTVSQPGPATNIVDELTAVTDSKKSPIILINRVVAPTKPVASQTVTRSRTAPPSLALPPPAPVEVVKAVPSPVVKRIADDSHNTISLPPAVVSTNSTAVPPMKSEQQGTLSRTNPVLREVKPQTVKTTRVAVPSLTPISLPEPDIPNPAGGRYVYQLPVVPQAGDRAAAERALVAGQQAQKLGHVAEAIQAYRRSGQLDGSWFEAHYRLGLAAFQARSFRLALAAWETALVLQPDSADARYNFALTLKASNYPIDAANELERLLAVHPDEARAHLTLGNLYAEQFRDVPRARQHYGRVLQLDPRNPQAQSIRYWLVANPG